VEMPTLAARILPWHQSQHSKNGERVIFRRWWTEAELP